MSLAQHVGLQQAKKLELCAILVGFLLVFDGCGPVASPPDSAQQVQLEEFLEQPWP